METDSSRMIILNGPNYHIWRRKMEDLLYVKDYNLPVFSSEKPENKSDEEWRRSHRRACAYIRQWVHDNVFIHVSEEKDARSLWTKLEDLYAPKTCMNKLVLMRRMMGLRYRDGESMHDHVNALQEIVNRLTEMDIKLDDEVQGSWLLATLPESWETFGKSLCNSAPNGVVTMDLVKSSVLEEERRRKSRSSSSLSGGGPKNRDRSKSKSNKYANVECHRCNEMGHIKRFCPKLESENEEWEQTKE